MNFYAIFDSDGELMMEWDSRGDFERPLISPTKKPLENLIKAAGGDGYEIRPISVTKL